VPTGTAAVNIKRKRATLAWDDMAGALDYTVEFRVAGSADWSSIANTVDTSINATSLNNGTTYEWRVRSNCGAEASAFSAICSFTAGQSNSSSCAGERAVLATVIAYPNPADGAVRIEAMMKGNAAVTVHLMDALGRVVLSQQMNDDFTLDLDVSSLEAGIYMVRATNGAEEDVIRLVIE
jgi:hypothetical protein